MAMHIMQTNKNFRSFDVDIQALSSDILTYICVTYVTLGHDFDGKREY